ncbi:MAG: hypothetical protein KZQ83_17095 [gamma proteobacterium symbiont of Taylorina sp.]|nr:hypothetical protein [gamma proteobacterium symbiont of Taylorina sp.]
MKKILTIILLSPILFFSACNAGKYVNAKGRFIYTSGDGSINSINFNTSDFKTLSIYKSKTMSTIDNLVKSDDNTVLFGECPISGGCIIKQYSIDTMQSRLLRTGRLSNYIINHNKVFFYDKASDDKNWLFVASVNNINEARKVAKEPLSITLPNGIKQSIAMPVIQILKNDIIFVGEDKELWEYNIVENKTTPTGIKDCRPALWIDKRDNLLCTSWNKWEPFLLNLNTNNRVKISHLKGAYGFEYIPENDALIYGRTKSKYLIGETYNIYYYSFLDRKEKKIKKDSHIAAGVWFNNRTNKLQ